MPKFSVHQSLIGEKFDRLKVVEYLGTQGKGERRWRCVCVCGNFVEASTDTLRRKHTKSCGCLKRDMQRARCTTHGMSRIPEHDVWGEIKARCLNKKNKAYPVYGGRGIAVCERWRNSFELFISDMGRRPTPLHSIDRINNDGNYEPGNCRWATMKEQSRNRQNNIVLTVDGTTRNIHEWSALVGIAYGTILYRVNNGWSHKRATTIKPTHLQ